MNRGRGPFSRMWRVRAPAFLLALVMLAAMSSIAGADTKQELREARARLAQIEADVAAASAKLASLREQAADAVAEVEGAQDVLDDTLNALDRVRQAIARAQTRYEALQARLDARVREAYINGPGSGLDVILGSQTIADLTDRVELVDAVVENDAELSSDVANLRASLEVERANLEDLRAVHAEQARELQARADDLEANLTEQRDTMESLQANATEARSIVADLEDQLRAEEIAAARAAARAAEEAANDGGDGDGDGGGDGGGGGGGDGGGGGSPPPPSGDGPLYVCPVDHPRSYTDTFGDPRSGGRTHQGADIFAPRGTPIRAPFNGTAEDASNWPLGGYAVKVYGANGYVYNAHLDSIGQLGSVQAGDIIGYVGNTGNASSTAPHNHFEWHPGGGSAVNPTPYLDDVC